MSKKQSNPPPQKGARPKPPPPPLKNNSRHYIGGIEGTDFVFHIEPEKPKRIYLGEKDGIANYANLDEDGNISISPEEKPNKFNGRDGNGYQPYSEANFKYLENKPKISYFDKFLIVFSLVFLISALISMALNGVCE